VRAVHTKSSISNVKILSAHTNSTHGGSATVAKHLTSKIKRELNASIVGRQIITGKIESDKQTINDKSCSATAANNSQRWKVKTLIYAKPALIRSSNLAPNAKRHIGV
jgi:hypothetical protein